MGDIVTQSNMSVDEVSYAVFDEKPLSLFVETFAKQYEKLIISGGENRVRCTLKRP
jgi:hypothetical protein